MKTKISIRYAGGVAFRAFTCYGACERCLHRFQCYTSRELVLEMEEAREMYARASPFGFNRNERFDKILLKSEFRWEDLRPINMHTYGNSAKMS